MSDSRNCPRCLQEIHSSRWFGSPTVCNSCGFVLSGKQKISEEKFERSFLVSIIVSAALFVSAFIHFANWGSAGVEVIAFKLGQIAGWNSKESVNRMAQICLDLKKYDCTERLYLQLARMDFKEYSRLGKFQFAQRKFKEAADSYKNFFASHGEDVEAHYIYARALGEIGDIDEAARHFDYVLSTKPDVVQITVVQNYVKYLIRANQLDHARRVIQQVRRRSETVSSFMEAELKDILQRRDGSV